MKPTPLTDLADSKAWEDVIHDAEIARHGERERARKRVAKFAHDLLRRDVRAKRRAA